ncbi:hypothetical protein H8356DRAFT_1425149 [Neocallimastix lanati (nom. inval.)]|nr:hypothetical protein H8356DRAFT_1425149 [Neocallimastix sp. JGI-2020a]
MSLKTNYNESCHYCHINEHITDKRQNRIFNEISIESPFQANYQLFIIRTYVKELSSIYPISFSILKNKEQRIYEALLEEIKKNA